MSRLLVEPGRVVSLRRRVGRKRRFTLNAELDYLRARVAELETTLASERFTDRVKAEITTTELGKRVRSLTTTTNRAERLIARSAGDGLFSHQDRRICPAAS